AGGEITLLFTPSDNGYNSKTLTVKPEITKKAVTVTIKDASMTAGDKLPDFGYSVTGLIAGDSEKDLNIRTACSADTTKAGKYTITGTASSDYYDVTVKSATLTVTEKPVVKVTPDITGTPVIKIVYGQKISDGSITGATASCNGTSVNGKFTVIDEDLLHAGDYTVKAVFTPDDTVHYNEVKDVTVTVRVVKKPVTVTIDSKTMTAGDDVPALTASTDTELVGTDTVNSLVTMTTTAKKSSPAGKYEITGKVNADATDYNVTVKNGTLTINVKTEKPVTTYRITYYLNGGTASGNPGTYTEKTDSFTLNAPVREGYTFAGWTKNNSDTLLTAVTVKKGTTGNLVFTAHWKKDAASGGNSGSTNTSTSTGNNSGTGNSTQTGNTTGSTTGNSTTGSTGNSTTGSTTNPTGNNASGNTGNNTTNTTGNTGNSQSTSTKAKTYKVTYDLNGGYTYRDDNPSTYTTGDVYFLFAPARAGYTFIGWTGSNGSTPQTLVTISRTTTGDLTYKANWQKLESTTNDPTANSTGAAETPSSAGTTSSESSEPSDVTTDVSVPDVKVKLLKSTQKTITLKFSEADIDTDGEVRYQVAIKKKGASSWTKSTLGKTSKTFKKLKKHTTYWVSVRAYVTIDGETYCGDWADTKVIKTK
ncbi:MAG: MBG domain-containing protein, partial [Candidatus Weimeria sp.]